MGSGLTPEIHEGDLSGLLGPIAKAHGLREVLLVTDYGVKKAGHSELARRSLEQAGVSVREYDQVRSNPTDVDVQRCAGQAVGVDGFVAVGGGSCIDTAKGASFILTNGGSMVDYWGFRKTERPLLPLIAVPTTAGTGSEVQSYALISDARTHIKMACGAPGAMPVAAILDAHLTVTLNRKQTAYSGLDAIVHAVESAVCTQTTGESLELSCEAFELLVRNLPLVLADPLDLSARGGMLRGAMLAGRAIEGSMLGAAHAAANPLTANFGVPHGLAVATMLPHVVRFNASDKRTLESYRVLSALVSPESLVQQLERLLVVSGVEPLSKFGVPREAIEKLAREAAAQWTAQFNPRPISVADFEALYESALAG